MKTEMNRSFIIFKNQDAEDFSAFVDNKEELEELLSRVKRNTTLQRIHYRAIDIKKKLGY